MLIYHPAYDVSHCQYRILLISENSQYKEIDWELFKFLDFYLLFPHLLKNISPFPNAIRAFKSVANKIPDAYESIANPRRVMFTLGSIQHTAIMNLIGKNLIDLDGFKKKVIVRSDADIPTKLQDALGADASVDEQWFRLIVNELPSVQFNGRMGLKGRSGLMEFRYDIEAPKDSSA